MTGDAGVYATRLGSHTVQGERAHPTVRRATAGVCGVCGPMLVDGWCRGCVTKVLRRQVGRSKSCNGDNG